VTADLPRVLEIENACFSTPWKDATFRGLMRRTDTDLYVAELEDRIVGYSACWTVIDQSELGNVAVAESSRTLTRAARFSSDWDSGFMTSSNVVVWLAWPT